MLCVHVCVCVCVCVCVTLQAVQASLRPDASICMFVGVTACSCDVWLFSPSVGDREVKSFGRAFVSFGILQAAVQCHQVGNYMSWDKLLGLLL